MKKAIEPSIGVKSIIIVQTVLSVIGNFFSPSFIKAIIVRDSPPISNEKLKICRSVGMRVEFILSSRYF